MSFDIRREERQRLDHPGQMNVVAGDEDSRFRPIANKGSQNQGVVAAGSARDLDDAGAGQDFLNLFQTLTPFC